MKENNLNLKLLKGYNSPEAEMIKISSVDIIRTSDEWDLPEIPVGENGIKISI